MCINNTYLLSILNFNLLELIWKYISLRKTESVPLLLYLLSDWSVPLLLLLHSLSDWLLSCSDGSPWFSARLSCSSWLELVPMLLLMLIPSSGLLAISFLSLCVFRITSLAWDSVCSDAFVGCCCCLHCVGSLFILFIMMWCWLLLLMFMLGLWLFP